MEDVASKVSGIWKTNSISLLVLLHRVDLLYWNEVLISCHLPNLTDVKPRNPKYPQRFLELCITLPCQDCALCFDKFICQTAWGGWGEEDVFVDYELW